MKEIGFIAWWVHNPVAANLLMVAILIGGVLGYSRMEREVFPNTRPPSVQIDVSWPGASPKEVEDQIVLRIEEAIATVDGVKSIISVAQEETASVTVQAQEIVDMTRFTEAIRIEIEGISGLPDGIFPPTVRRTRITEPVLYLALFGESDPLALHEMAVQLRREIASLPGGSPLVSILDPRQLEIVIEVDPESLRRFNISMEEIAASVRAQSLNVSTGTIRAENGNIQLRAQNLATTPVQFESIVLRQSSEGGLVLLSDIATIAEKLDEAPYSASFNGQPMVSLVVNVPETSDVVTLASTVKDWIELRNQTLPDGLSMEVWYDDSELYFARLNLVGGNALIGLALVLATLMLFLRPTIAFWVSVGICISYAGAFFLMPSANVSLNILSLFAFLLVAGVIVDDAIVVGENIHRHVENGEHGADAAVSGASHVAKPVLVGVLTTMFVFIPWLFLPGETSELTRHISVTIILALTFSLVESFLILPAHLSHLRHETKKGRLQKFQDTIARSLVTLAETTYRPVARLAITWRYVTITGFVSVFVIAMTVVTTGWVRFEFFPAVEGTQLTFEVTMPTGTPFSDVLNLRDQIVTGTQIAAEALEEENEGPVIDSIYAEASEGFVTAYVNLVPSRDRSSFPTRTILSDVRDAIGELPMARRVAATAGDDAGGPAFEFGIEADTLDTLQAATIDVRTYLADFPGIRDVGDDLSTAERELTITLKPGAESLGFTLAEVSNQVRQAFFGEEIQRIPTAAGDMRVMLRFPQAARARLETLDRLLIRAPDGAFVPFSEVGLVTSGQGVTTINRYDRSRSATVFAYTDRGVDAGPIEQAFFQDFVPELLERYPGLRLALRGEAEEERAFFSNIAFPYAIALLAIYGLIAVAFRSYTLPFLIMAAIPFGYMGAVFGHWVLGMPMALFSFFGIGAAAGVVINDNLVLMDQVGKNRSAGQDVGSALVNAGVKRFRPILLTSVTTFIGLAPLLLETSPDAQFLKPTVIALSFGVLVALFVTLLFVPAMYVVGLDLKKLMFGRSADPIRTKTSEMERSS